MNNEILLRFNHKAAPDSPLVWRVSINGEWHFASGFEVTGKMYDVVSYEDGVKKYNVGCIGLATWDDTCVKIKSNTL